MFQIQMQLERETKGALRFQEIDMQTKQPVEITAGAKIGTLYVRKTAFPSGTVPARIDVTVHD